MRGDHNPAGLIEQAVDAEHIQGRTYGGGPFIQLGRRNIRVQQQVLDFADRLFGGENSQNMKAEGSGQLDPGED